MIKRINFNDDGVNVLLTQSDQYLMALYPSESCHLMSASALNNNHVDLLGYQHNGQLLGMIAMVNYATPSDVAYVELKRWVVHDSARDKGIGRQLMHAAINAVAQTTTKVIRVETGIHQPDAIKVLEQEGFVRREPFGSYTDDPLSMYLQLNLE
ncbi:Uncharacterised protein [BD1-7 clade bacterium]|uniref:N-acetyltransferase domain-containing protein n=1 Tax=BD1-7 clade bacterium TaxID=2029982 RepID=A0A5S9NRR9_9GAMM|nr:Uncharacterised protein [BD1-7 clade bacterium]CAA0093068.1 Uncharacterised protein [BD1-7 clade bacterium]